jgi:hypothetical protein
LNDFGWESVALIHFGLCHEIDPDRLALNLSVPTIRIENAQATFPKTQKHAGENIGNS